MEGDIFATQESRRYQLELQAELQTKGQPARGLEWSDIAWLRGWCVVDECGLRLEYGVWVSGETDIAEVSGGVGVVLVGWMES